MFLYNLKLENGLIEMYETSCQLESIRNYRDKLPEQLDDMIATLCNNSSDLYKYRRVRKSVMELAVKVVNHAILNSESYLEDLDQLRSVGGVTEDTFDWMYKAAQSFKLIGYSKARLTNITYKVAAVLNILSKNRGIYNKQMYNKVTTIESRKSFKYQDTTYIPASDMKRICGEHSASDYLTIKYALINYGCIKEISNSYYYVADTIDPLTGEVLDQGRGIAKPYWINPDVLEEVYSDSEMILVPSNTIYESTIDQYRNLKRSYQAAIAGLLKLKVSDQLYEAALKRIKSSVKGEVLNGDEDNEDAELIYRNKITIRVRDAKNVPISVELTSQAANVIIAMHEFDLFTLLRYTIDDYSGRLHTVITRLTKNLRSHLIWNDGESVCDSDIQSCQPMLLTGLLARDGYPEVAEMVQDKDFYKFMAAVANKEDYDSFELSAIARKEEKSLFMGAAYGKGKDHTKFVDMLADIIVKRRGSEEAGDEFRKYFLELIDGQSERNIRDGYIVTHRKRVLDNGHIENYLPSALPKRMQSMEVEIMFGEDGVIERLIRAGINDFTTIHDSVVIRKRDMKLAQEIMQATFTDKLQCEGTGLVITAKTEEFTTSSRNHLTWK